MFVHEFRERSGLHVDLEITRALESEELDNDQQMALYRFTQEALANVRRHSGSETASVRFCLDHGVIEASVTDEGQGIALPRLHEIQESDALAGGVGISGMRERMRFVGGHLEIQSNEHGTKFTAVMPLQHQEISEEQS